MKTTIIKNNDLNILEIPLFEIFTHASNPIIKSKSALIGLCSEIDRFLSITTDIDISKSISNEQYNNLFVLFPNIKDIPIDILDKYFLLIRDIRNLSAHLFLTNKLKVDFELLEKLYEIATPLYKVEFKGKLTFYGCSYVLSFVSQKYQTWPFITSYYNKNITGYRGEKLSKIQVEINHHSQTYCGTSYPIYPEQFDIPPGQLIYLNNLVKDTLTKIFFNLEFLLSKRKNILENNNQSFKQILENGRTGFSTNLINRLNSIRNLWFHGTMIYDTIVDDYINEFSLETITDVLIELIEESKSDVERYKYINNRIRNMGHRIYDFCGLKIVEVSYKLIDKELFDVEKMEERIGDSIRAFDRLIEMANYGFLELAYKLSPVTHKYNLTPSKFIDKRPRSITTNKLIIYKIHSKQGISINEFTTKQNLVYICFPSNENIRNIYRNINLNKICNINILNLKATHEYSLGQTHEIYSVIIE